MEDIPSRNSWRRFTPEHSSKVKNVVSLLLQHPNIRKATEKPIRLEWFDDEPKTETDDNIILPPTNPTTEQQPSDASDVSDAEQNKNLESENQVQNPSTQYPAYDKDTESKEPEISTSLTYRIVQKSDITQPIVSVENFFSNDMPLPDHSLEQSPCYTIIDVSQDEMGFQTYHCKLHPELMGSTFLTAIENHCRDNPDTHKTEILRLLESKKEVNAA